MPAPTTSANPTPRRDLTGRSWGYVLRKTWREFGDDHCTDLAAGLTYYAVLALFPAAIAVISLVGVVGQGQNSVDKIIEILQPLVSSEHARHRPARPGEHRQARSAPGSAS